MTKFLISSFAFALLLLIHASGLASTVAADEGEGLQAVLVGQWTHAYEDEQEVNGPRTYVRSDSRDFPPSRFRMRYVFNADGTCQWLHLSPTDRHRMTDCTWALDEADATKVLIFNAEGERQPVSFAVTEIDKDTLKLTPLVE